MAENDGERVEFDKVAGATQEPTAEPEPPLPFATKPEPQRKPVTRIQFRPGSDGGAPTYYQGMVPIGLTAGIDLGGPAGGEPFVLVAFDVDEIRWAVKLKSRDYGAGPLGVALIAAARMADPAVFDAMSGLLDALVDGRIADVATIRPAASDAQRLLFNVWPKTTDPMVLNPTTWVASQEGVQSVQVRVELAQGENAGGDANPNLIEIAICAGNRWLTAGLTSPSAIVLGATLIAAAGASGDDVLTRYGRDAMAAIRRKQAPLSRGWGGVVGPLYYHVMPYQIDTLWRRGRIPEQPVTRLQFDAVAYPSADAVVDGRMAPEIGWPFIGKVTAEALGPGEYAASQQRQGEWVAKWNAGRAQRAA